MSGEQPQMPGGYETGTAAIADLVRLSQMLSAAHDCRDRLRHAGTVIDSLINQTDAARRDALRAVERFADEDPGSLGVSPSQALGNAIDVVDSNLTALERDVKDIVNRAGGSL